MMELEASELEEREELKDSLNVYKFTKNFNYSLTKNHNYYTINYYTTIILTVIL